MLTGLARDGGLYLPESIPQMSHSEDIRALRRGAAMRRPRSG